MRLTSLASRLHEAISELDTIDAHEHLPAEADYLAAQYSGLNLFAGGYIWHDLESAGLPIQFKTGMRQGGYHPVDEWWPVIRPYWEQVKNTSFARALRITARGLFGIADIDDSTIHELAASVQADNTPGLYRRVLHDRCHIAGCITCVDQASFPNDPGLRGITMLVKQPASDPVFPGEQCSGSDILSALSGRVGHPVRTLDEAVQSVQSLLWSDVQAGAVGFKAYVAEHAQPDRAQAEAELAEAIRLGDAAGPCPALQTFLFEKGLDVAAAADVPVAIHTGYWADFRQLDPKHMLSFALRRRDVRFDLLHLGMPMIRDALLIGKSLPNVTVNLCWSPVVSQVQTIRALDELIDLVPVNKVIAFGGDYRVAVHKAYGHLVMAREAVATALARRIEAGDFDVDYALHVARLWFYDNPRRIYGLDRQPSGPTR